MFCVASSGSFASLSWKSDVLELSANTLDDSVSGAFIFSNGDSKTQIISVKSSCGCTIVDAPKGVIDPGQDGEVKVKFQVKGRYGTQEKYVLLSEYGDKEPKQLLLRVSIAPVVELIPNFINCSASDVPKPILVKLEVNKLLSVKILGVESLNKKFEAELIKGDDGVPMAVKVSPLQLVEGNKAVIQVRGEASGRIFFESIYVNVSF